MALTQKTEMPRIYASEQKRREQLALKESEYGDLLPGENPFISPSSGISYNVPSNTEQELLNILNEVLKDYYVKSSEYNEIIENFEDPIYLNHTQNELVKSLPEGSLEGSVKDLSFDGLTLVNEVENGDFSDGTDGWFGSGAILEVNNNTLFVTGDGTLPDIRAYKNIGSGYSDEKWFFYAKYRVTSSDAISVSLLVRDGTGGTIISNIDVGRIENQWYENYSISTLANDTVSGIFFIFNHQYINVATANGKVMEVDGNAGIFAINMTDLGIESYTEEQMLDLVRSGYFDEMKSVENPGIEVVGKNLFDKNDVDINILVKGTDGGVSGSTAYNTIKHTRVKPSTDYTYSQLEGNSHISWYDSEKDFISGIIASGLQQTITLTSPSDAHYVRISAQNESINPYNLDNAQLEEGTTATAYEPHQSHQIKINETFRRVKNDTKDSCYMSNNEVWKDKRVEEISKTSGTVLNTTNLTSAKANGSYVAYQTDGTLLTGVVDGTDTLTADATVVYELATPQQINLTDLGKVEGELLSEENGTCYLSGDSLFSQNVSFQVPANTGAVNEGLLQSSDYQAKNTLKRSSVFNEDNYGNPYTKITSFTVGEDEQDSVIYLENSSNINITIDNTTDVNLKDNSQTIFIANGAGTVTFIATGVNLYSKDNNRVIDGQYSWISLIKQSNGEYYLAGALTS